MSKTMKDYITYKEYIGTVNFSDEDEVFYGKVHGINDLISFEGKSVKELKHSFEESIDDYLATCKEHNKQPNKTFKGSFNVRVSTELHRKASFIASKKSISLNDFVKRAISYAISHADDIDKTILIK
jgi:predicted HicB family RNase H-like nuclease